MTKLLLIGHAFLNQLQLAYSLYEMSEKSYNFALTGEDSFGIKGRTDSKNGASKLNTLERAIAIMAALAILAVFRRTAFAEHSC